MISLRRLLDLPHKSTSSEAKQNGRSLGARTGRFLCTDILPDCGKFHLLLQNNWLAFHHFLGRNESNAYFISNPEEISMESRNSYQLESKSSALLLKSMIWIGLLEDSKQNSVHRVSTIAFQIPTDLD
ncbi:hypothetical protein TNIN_268361 [Trichonephila inaurata madagascariensis]|uniref:Uncharacterized protein n=1 Tax=Trichonephila inaurata madagascariensis TaxID=2747483 RepID=A0A8X7CSA5_9ARAC|nr:hypothetical protein TNIN_268361 [Trichonephila inaurata madagascariensis]